VVVVGNVWGVGGCYWIGYFVMCDVLDIDGIWVVIKDVGFDLLECLYYSDIDGCLVNVFFKCEVL